MEEKAAKYAHIPVYNRQEELKKAREREAKLAQLFSGTYLAFSIIISFLYLILSWKSWK